MWHCTVKGCRVKVEDLLGRRLHHFFTGHNSWAKVPKQRESS